MIRRSARVRAALLVAGVLVVLGFLAWAYRDLPGRLFVADDYQWLVNTRSLGRAALMRRAFDPSEQQHFFRPLVWLLIAAQQWLFGPDALRFHLVSLALHVAVATLCGLLAWRLLWPAAPWRMLLAWLAGAIVALHPAPFEAVVWVSAQSELAGALFLLLALHAWLTPGRWSVALATVAMACAMLAKESAILALPLMALLAPPGVFTRRRALLPTLLTLVYAALQVYVARTNTVLREGQYGIGPHLITNPLRSLALVVAPLGNSEHADGSWLAPTGTGVALVILVFAAWNLLRDIPARPSTRIPPWRAAAALALTLAPTAPFFSPPDSRYLYLAVIFAALLVSLSLASLGAIAPGRRVAGAAAVALALLVCGWMPGELAAREWRFGAGSGSNGSLWRVASDVCAMTPADRPGRLVVIDPPILPAHVEAIVHLACGDETEAVVAGRADFEHALRERSVAIGFRGGSAVVEQWR